MQGLMAELFVRQEAYHEMLGRLYTEVNGEKERLDMLQTAKNITFQVTDSCNLACSYCYQKHKGTRVMPVETAKALVDLILSGEKGMGEYLHSDRAPGVILDFIGGEPMLALEVMDETIDYFHRRVIELDHPWKDRWRVSMISNGTIYDDKVKQFLKKHENHLSFDVTVDGNKKLHDTCRRFPDGRPSYDLAAGVVRDRMEQGYFIGNKLTIAHENLPYLFEAVTDMVKDGHRALNANTVFEDVWQEGDPAIFYRELKKLADFLLEDERFSRMDCTLFSHVFFVPCKDSEVSNYCGGTGNMLAMDPDGHLYPCLRYMESSVGDEFPACRIGNVRDGIGATVEEIQRVKCLRCIDRKTQSSEECFHCPIGSGCAWCSGYNYQVYGTADRRTTYICGMHKARALANVYYRNKLAKLVGREELKLKCWVPKEWALTIVDEAEYRELLALSGSGEMTVEKAYERAKEYAAGKD